ncbi:MAG: BREX-3 system phosphatase PglZ [Chloroflexi bacterium]|nr:BREX-3 system phosphatase PglZ [Chloroflexota bacterium]
MLDSVLSHFPAHTHPLTIVHDPDGLLADEMVLAELSERGFSIIVESDPVHLRRRVEQDQPFAIDHQAIVITPGPLNALPYDLWQQGHHVMLALHSFFPNLAYPVVRGLTPAQRWHLSLLAPPERPLGRQATVDYVLRGVFSVDFDALRQPAHLLAWLNRYHQQTEPTPAVLIDRLLARLRSIPEYSSWPLDRLLANRDEFAEFVREQWSVFVQRQTGQPIKEAAAQYLLHFESDHGLRDGLPSLLRSGALEPIAVDQLDRLPEWARFAVLGPNDDSQSQRLAGLLSVLLDQLGTQTADRWPEWQGIARSWAQINALFHSLPGVSSESESALAFSRLQKRLDTGFLEWLRRHYSPLASQRLPAPNHVHHVPHYLAYERRQGRTRRVALLILDGMALADWQIIGSTWKARHQEWRLQEHLLLAQIPTITAVSRQSLVSGKRPADFAGTLSSNQAEAHQWAAFWRQEGLAPNACHHAILRLERGDVPPDIDSSSAEAVCLVIDDIDDMMHGTRLGAAGLDASLRLWLDVRSVALETTIDDLLSRGFVVYVASDHGHVEARGIGQPSEGITAQTRGRRARIYGDPLAAARWHQTFPQTVLWDHDGLLPDDVRVLMPAGRSAFAAFGETVVTHGGPTLDEVAVPFVTITRG